ncbi:D-alanyl-D-alanine dipeptidase [Endozoicomonas sp. OPT23]|uniref:D-alanyl-D-alanine dipeptidase n=1 Tax=Endozoicomonas sp. OPT23 TaxID=2072845 RepID=UPI00129AED80|nr:D-alanyl-D-alanine dipeptidase [Endozoicomonas sp. OPT23]MRI34650.1 D-alanyl-D-alanine dipeptidase [Endozoicomonas sp. OPT23]
MNTESPLVSVQPIPDRLIIDLAYATAENVTGKPIYISDNCMLHKSAEAPLMRALELLEPLGLGIKIMDAYRPLSAQKALFQAAPNPEYVSHPETGVRPHCRGTAIDLTLIDSHGNELNMGTDFDDFRPLAHHGNTQVSEQAQRNRLLLAGIMSVAGFTPLQSEWWHYQLPDSNQYPILSEADVQSGLMPLDA